MFKKKIKYVDFNGIDREEDFYFHLSLPDSARLEAKFGGVPIETYAENLMERQDQDQMLKFLEDIILTSYGEKSEDGKSFMKTPAIRSKFEYSQAYAELFAEFLNTPGAAESFAKGVSEQTQTLKKNDTKKQ